MTQNNASKEALEKGRTMQLTPKLRYLWRNGERVLQQAYQCIEDGTIEWHDVPLEIEQ